MNVFMLARIAEAGPRDLASVRAGRVGAELPAGFDDWFSTITSIVPDERYPTATVAVEVLAETTGVDLAPIPPPRSRSFHLLSESTPRALSAPQPGPASDRARAARQSPLRASEIAAPEPSSTPDVELRSRSGDTPPSSSSRSAPLWRQPAVMTSAILGIGALIALAIGLAPARPTDTSPPLGAPAAELPASSEPSVTPAAPQPPSASPPSTEAEPEPPPASSTTTTASSSATSPASPSARPLPVPVRRPPAAPSASAKRPKYTRE
jgi:serine/threonine-protein kinase